jgi:hypothetical protein
LGGQFNTPRVSHALSASAEPGVPPSAISSIRLWHQNDACDVGQVVAVSQGLSLHRS